MSEHPILFSGEMVRAILEGRKTQTRRVLNPQPFLEKSDKGEWWCLDRSRDGYGKTNSCWRVGDEPFWTYCPYGESGDHLWVRESWRERGNALAESDGRCWAYRADDNEENRGNVLRWKPSIFMPRFASRLTLEIAKIRVERVQQIGFHDCIAEGIHPIGREHDTAIPRNEYRELWDKINAKRGFGWDANPWVWVIEFRNSSAAGGNRQEPQK